MLLSFDNAVHVTHKLLQDSFLQKLGFVAKFFETGCRQRCALDIGRRTYAIRVLSSVDWVVNTPCCVLEDTAVTSPSRRETV